MVNITSGEDTTGTLSTAGAITAFSVSVAAVPEPSTWLMMITGFGVFGALMRKRRSTIVMPAT